MNIKRLFLSIIFTFIFINVYGWVVHGLILNEVYQDLSFMLNPFRKMGILYGWSLLSQFLLACAICLTFIFFHQGKGIKKGLLFGLYLGAIFAAEDIFAFTTIPVSLSICFTWATFKMVEYITVGIILSLTYKELRA